MKYLYKIILPIVFISFYAFSQPFTYIWQNPRPQGNPLFKIKAFDSLTAMAVGSVGTVMITSDGGSSWTQNPNKIKAYDNFTQEMQTVENWIWSIHFYNRGIGWAVGGGAGLILYTDNFGETWMQQYSGLNTTLQSVYFLENNMNVGWAVGWNGNILKTSDRGTTWQNQPSGSQATLFNVFFMNADTGWAVGERGTPIGNSIGELLRTTNGGASWQQMNTGVTNRLWDFEYKNNACFITGWFGYIGKSMDFGYTFKTIKTPATGLIYAIEFPTNTTGYAAGEYGTFMKSTDAGDTWKQLGPICYDHIYSLSFVDSLTGWAVGEYGIIYKTKDGGLSWDQQTNKYPSLGITNEIRDVKFLSKDTAFAVGERGLILKTEDRGSNWSDYSYNVTSNYSAVDFPTSSIGYIVGDSGKLLKTTDNGNTWLNLTIPRQDYYCIHFVDQYTGFIGGRAPRSLLKTTDGGFNWVEQIYNTGVTINSIEFMDKDTGWAAGYGSLYKTTNGGQTWISKGNFGNLLCVKFYNKSIGWVSGADGSIYRTSDGGESWLRVPPPTRDEISRIYISDSLNLWAVGKWGRLFKSVNSGFAWTISQTNTSNFLNALNCDDKTTGLLFGKGGTIMRFFDGDPKPMIFTNPGEISFTAQVGGDIPPAQVVSITSISGKLNWTAEKDDFSWFFFNAIENGVSVQISTTNLEPGRYVSYITVKDPNAINSPQRIKIKYYLYMPGTQPSISLGGVKMMRFEAEKGGKLPYEQIFTITNDGKGSLEWSLSKDTNWLDISPIKGLDSNDIRVNANTTNLSVGDHSATITVKAPGAVNDPQKINILYTIYSPPTIKLSDTVFSFSSVQGGPLPANKTVRVTNLGRRPFYWSASKSSTWLKTLPDTGTDGQNVTLSITNNNLALGKYQDRIYFNSKEAVNSRISVRVEYEILPNVKISFPKDTINFPQVELGEYFDMVVSVKNSGSGILEVRVQTFSGTNAGYFIPLTATPVSIPEGKTSDMIFRFKPLKRGKLSAQLEVTSNAGLQNGGKLIVPFTGTGIDTRPPLITTDHPWEQPANFKEQAKVDGVSASDISGIKRFQVLFRQSNEKWDTLSRKKDFPSNQNASQYIPGSSMTQNGVDFKIIAEDSAGNMATLLNPISTPERPIKFFSLPVTIAEKSQLDLSFTTPKVTTPLKDAKKFYRMFATPLIFDNVKAKDLWGYLGDYKYKWRFRAPVDPNTDGTNFVDGENEVLKSGVSYFIITKDECTITGSTGYTKRFDEFYKDGIDLQPGYNFIGNPFAFEIPQGKLKILDTLQELKNSSWYFSGESQDSWVPNTSFPVFGGYCIRAINPTKLYITDEEIPIQPTALQKEAVDGWQIQLTANDGEQYDTYNYIGMKHSSKDKYDKNDMFEPPRLDDRLALFFKHNDWDKFSGEYSGDFKEFNNNGAAWEFTITADKNKIINLNLNNLSNLPSEFNMALFDKDFQRFIPLKNGSAVVGSDKGIRNFILLTGNETYLSEEKQKCRTIPTEFNLHQNFPNPFNPSTTIYYQIPLNGHVKIEVFNLLGSLVRTLVNDNMNAGSYEINFDASENGAIASGIYFYRMQFTGPKNLTYSRKMMFLK